MTKHKAASLYFHLTAIFLTFFQLLNHFVETPYLNWIKPWQKLKSQVPTAK